MRMPARDRNPLRNGLLAVWPGLLALGVLFPPVSLGGQTSDRAVVTLRVWVNVVPTVQTASQAEVSRTTLVSQRRILSPGAVLIWSEASSHPAQTVELRNLGETIWGAELQEQAAAFTGAKSAHQRSPRSKANQQDGSAETPSAVRDAAGDADQAQLLTRTVLSN
jgi:hypothetical protein